MPLLTINLLGTPEVRVAGAPVGFSRRQPLALLAYLAAAEAPVPRGRLLLLLFADCDESLARQRLSRLLYELRRALAAGAAALQFQGETLSLDRSSCQVDLRDFTRSAHAHDEAQLRATLALYRGPLLDGFALADAPEFEAWCEQERTRLELLRQELLGRLLGRARERGAWQAAAELAQTLIACDPLREDAHLGLMEALAAQGQRGAMLRHYDALCELLRRELDAEPLPETRARYDELRIQVAAATLPPSAAPPAPPPAMPALPVVGREAELAAMQAAVSRVYEGASRLVVVNGVSGVGKTSLVEAVLALTPRSGLATLRLTCYATPPPAPYQALADALMGTLAPEENPLLRPRSMAAASAADAERALWEQLAVALRRAAETNAGTTAPLALFIDDLQWADSALLQALPYLARRLARLPLLLVIVYRSDEQPDALAETLGTLCRELELAAWLELQPLNATAVATLAQVALGDEGLTLAPRLFAETEGNALFLVETLRDLYARRVRGAPLELVALPGGVRAAIEAHLARLARPAIQVAEAAAVAGREVDVELLRQVVSVGEEALLHALEQLERAAVLTTTDTGLAFTHGKLQEQIYTGLSGVRRRQLHRRFALALGTSGRAGAAAMRLEHAWRAQDWELAYAAAREAAAQARRLAAFRDALAYEARALAALEQLVPDPERHATVIFDREEDAHRLGQRQLQAELLEQLDTLAPLAERGAELLFRRGRLLQQSGRPAEARPLLEQAAEEPAARQAALLELVPILARAGSVAEVHALGERLYAEARESQARLDVCLALTAATQELEDGEAARGWLERARPLTGARPGAQVRVWHLLARSELRRGDYRAMLQLAARARASYSAQGERAREAECLILEGVALGRQRRYSAAIGSFEQALAINRELGNPYGQATVSLNLAVQQCRLGDLELAAAGFAEAQRRYDEAGDTHGAVISAANLATVHSSRGDGAAAEAAARGALARAEAMNIPFLQAIVLSTLATALLVSGDASGAYEARQRALTLRNPAHDDYGPELAYQALACLALGRLDEADTLSAEAVRLAAPASTVEKPQFSFAIRALVAHRRGDVACAEEALAAAEQALEQVLVGMPSSQDRRRYLARVPVNRFLRAARAGDWTSVLPI